MSKFGRKPIIFENVQIEINENIISYNGKEASGKYELPACFEIIKSDNSLTIKPKDNIIGKNKKNIFEQWGLHRALIFNAIFGANKLFEKKIIIDGLGFKVQAQGSKLIFSLGFSHKIEYIIQSGVTIEIDKTGQMLTLKHFNKEVLGSICSKIRNFRPAEPYKGKGIRYDGEKILRKEGKKK